MSSSASYPAVKASSSFVPPFHLAPLQAIVAPSMLSGDFAHLARDAQGVVQDGADWLHLDIMDGHFVPNITIGPGVISSLRKHSSAYFDCHLMVSHPEQWVDAFADAGADGYTFHIESTSDADALISKIRSRGMRVGITLKPRTPLDSILQYVDKVDMVLVMTVEPGFGGQSFMHDQMSKVSLLRSTYPHLNIEVDGGLDEKTVGVAAQAGANVIVAGTAIFKSPDRKATINMMRHTVQKQIQLNANIKQHNGI